MGKAQKAKSLIPSNESLFLETAVIYKPLPIKTKAGKKKQNNYRVLKGKSHQSSQLHFKNAHLCFTQLNTKVIRFSAKVAEETQNLLKILSFLALHKLQMNP